MTNLSIRIYEKLPWWLQNTACSLEGLRIRNKRYGKVFNEALISLEKSDKWGLQDLKNYQEELLKKVVNNAYEFVPYYRKLFKDNNIKPNEIKRIVDLEKIPILTKKELQLNNRLFLNEKYNLRNIERGSTSGTTGRSLELFYTKEHQSWQWAVWWRHRRRFGIDVHYKYANFAGRYVVPITNMGLPAWRVNLPMNQTYFSIFHMTDNNLPYIVDYLNNNSYKFFSGYPSGIYVLASYLNKTNQTLKSKPKVIFTGAETLLSFHEQLFNKTICGTVADQYGLSEGCCNISQCENKNYHVDMEFGIIEFLPLEDRAQEDDKYKIVATGLCNDAMPLIRYDTGDIATISKEDCNCGRKTPVIKKIDGRIEDIIKTPDGRNIGRLDFVFKETKNIEEAQIIQTEINRIVVKVVANKSYNKKDEENLIKKLGYYVGDKMEINTDYVNYIEREPSGKFRAIVSKV